MGSGKRRHIESVSYCNQPHTFMCYARQTISSCTTRRVYFTFSLFAESSGGDGGAGNPHQQQPKRPTGNLGVPSNNPRRKNKNNSGNRNNNKRRRHQKNRRGRPPPLPLDPNSPDRGCFRELITSGKEVYVIKKEDQRSGQETYGVVDRLLTKSSYHPRGIKVMLTSGQVGRVIRIVEEVKI